MFKYIVFFAVINSLEWSSVFEPRDATDQEAVGFVENFYAGGFEGLKRLHEKWKCGLLTRENPAVNEYAGGGDPWDRYTCRMSLGEALPTQACGLGDDREDINRAVRIVKGLL